MMGRLNFFIALKCINIADNFYSVPEALNFFGSGKVGKS